MSIKNKLLYIPGITLFTMIFLSNIYSADTYAAASLTVSGDAIINLTSLSSEGNFAKSDNINITASTDSASGYKLMIQANNSTSLVSGNNSIASLDPGTSISEDTFKNGSYNGKWGFKPSMFNSAANTNFLPSPSTTGDIINATACANGTGSCPNEDSYTIAIGAKVNNTQPVGTYANTFNIMMVSNGIEYSITYRTAQVSNMPNDIAGETEASTVILASETPTRDGYNFLGWCSVQPAVDGSCSGTSYSPGQQISTSAASNLSLYARWGTTSTGNTIATATYMQDVTSCPSSLVTGQNYTLIDKRDGKTYTAAKQADGKCWMTQNLAIDIYGSDTAPLTSENTNINTSGAGAYVAGYINYNNLAVWVPSFCDSYNGTSGDVLSSHTVGLCEKYPAANNSYADEYLYPDADSYSETTYASLSECISAGHSEGDCKHHLRGGSYSWTAAIASNDSSSLKSDYLIASNDICPKGWRLPISKSSATASASTREYGQLLLKTGVRSYLDDDSNPGGAGDSHYASGGRSKYISAPLYFNVGYYQSSTIAAGVSSGMTSTPPSNNAYSKNYGLNGLGNTYLYSEETWSRQYVWAVRCVVK